MHQSQCIPVFSLLVSPSRRLYVLDRMLTTERLRLFETDHDDMGLVGEGWLLLSNTMDAATDHCEYFSVDRDNFFVGIYLT